MSKLMQTPSQTVGPYFAYGLTPEQYRYDFNSWTTSDMISELGSRISGTSEIQNPNSEIANWGRVLDGNGEPIPDAMVEFWLDDGEQQCLGRCGTGTDPQHRFWFRTTKPNAAAGNAPFLTVIVFMRGQLIHAFTRIYFEDEAERNAEDPVLQSVPAERRHTLLAEVADGAPDRRYCFDIHMQGENETVFFDL